MKPNDRYDWIEKALRAERRYGTGVDVLDSDFVDAYVEATNAAHGVPMWGALKCPQLGRDLAKMVNDGRLRRARIGLSGGAWQPGFPKWVWSYRLP